MKNALAHGKATPGFRSSIRGTLRSSEGDALQRVVLQARSKVGEVVGEGASRGGGEFSLELTVPQDVALELGQLGPFGWQSLGLGISGADDLALVGVGSRKGHLRVRFADARKPSNFVEVEYARAGAATFEPHPVNRTCSIGGGGVFALILPPDPSAVLRIRRPGAGNDDAWTLTVASVSTDAEAPTVVDLR